MRDYTTIGAIRDCLIRQYAETQKEISFYQAISLLEAWKYSDERQDVPRDRSVGPFPEDEFKDLVMKMPVGVTRIIKGENRPIKPEEIIFPLDRDVIGFCILPHVNDGMHVQDHFEIDYVYSGEVFCIFETGERVLQSGDCFFIAPGMKHNVLVRDEDSFVISFMIRRTAIDGFHVDSVPHDNLISMFFRNSFSGTGSRQYLCFQTDPNDLELKKLVQDVMIESNTDLAYGNIFSNLLLLQLFCLLLRQYGSSASYYGIGSNSEDVQTFSVILIELQRNYREITLEHLSRLTNYSPSYLSRLFRKNLGQSFSGVVQNLKMREVARLLVNTNLSIARIAEEVGYDSPDYLTRNFKKHYHCTPTEYRKQYKARH